MRQEVEGRGRGSHELIITDKRCRVCGGSLSSIVLCVSLNFSRIKKLKKYTWPGPTRDSPNASLQPGRAKFAFSHASHTPLHSQLGELQTGRPQALLASANPLSRSMGPPDHHPTTLILTSLYTPFPSLLSSGCFSLTLTLRLDHGRLGNRRLPRHWRHR
uniref:Uncharacterized protein n=1 Tax=Pongo abelii TaxID=9601 RepID=H2PLU0_PONAB